ncbi:MAG TPA: metallopeptidase family protein [Prosthecobacter sp.]
MREEHLLEIASAVVRQTMRELPEAIAVAAKDCLIQPVFMAECLGDGEEIDDDLLGVFEGLSLAEVEPSVPVQLPRIRLFLDNLWDYVGEKPDTFREEVRLTLLHELGHYLGLDEEQVTALGLA